MRCGSCCWQPATARLPRRHAAANEDPQARCRLQFVGAGQRSVSLSRCTVRSTPLRPSGLDKHPLVIPAEASARNLSRSRCVHSLRMLWAAGLPARASFLLLFWTSRCERFERSLSCKDHVPTETGTPLDDGSPPFGMFRRITERWNNCLSDGPASVARHASIHHMRSNGLSTPLPPRFSTWV